MVQTKLIVGDSVVVKPNMKAPDLNNNIGGWQGRVSEINEHNLICVCWDSLSLKQMPSEIIDQCEEEGLGWSEIYLYPTDVEITTPRDSKKDVANIIDYLESKHAWSHLGEEGKRIQSVLAKAEDSSEWAAYEAWENYFQRIVKFPFEGEISEFQEGGPLQEDDEVTVLEIEGSDNPYGVLVTVRRAHNKYVFPLCDIEVVDRHSSNHQPIQDYAVWFANR